MDAIYDLNVSDLECPGLSSVGDPSNVEKTLEVINGDIDAEYFDIVIDDEPVDDSIRQIFKLLLETTIQWNLLKTILSSTDSEEIIYLEECFGTIGSGMRETMYTKEVVRSEAIKGTITVIYVLFGSGESKPPMYNVFIFVQL